MGVGVWGLGPEEIRVAFTSADEALGVGVLSCGHGTNGIAIPVLQGGVADAAARGWGIKVGSIACVTRKQRLALDTLPIGAAPAATCAVRDQDGNASYAFISVTDSTPHFRVVLGE